jgi:dTDP-glucose 4,6-dehydratase
VIREERPRALVTGGAGFLGSHLCERLVAEDYLVVCVDNLSTGVRENVAHLEGDPSFAYVHHDVTSPLQIGGRLDEVYHFASPASPKDFERIPGQILMTGSAAPTTSWMSR